MRITTSGAKANRGSTSLDARQNSVRRQHAQRDADGGQQQRLGQQLANDAAALRPHRGAHRELVLPRRALRQQQNRHVSASDRQQQCDRAEEQIQGSAHAPVHPVVEPLHLHLECSGKRFGMSLANWSSSGCSAASAAWCVTPGRRRKSTMQNLSGSARQSSAADRRPRCTS